MCLVLNSLFEYFFFYKFENLNFGPLSNITLFQPPCDTVQEKCSSHENAV